MNFALAVGTFGRAFHGSFSEGALVALPRRRR